VKIFILFLAPYSVYQETFLRKRRGFKPSQTAKRKEKNLFYLKIPYG
jgi:hypothetical protein